MSFTYEGVLVCYEQKKVDTDIGIFYIRMEKIEKDCSTKFQELCRIQFFGQYLVNEFVFY